MTDSKPVSFNEFEVGCSRQNTQETIAAYTGYLAAYHSSVVPSPPHPLSPDFIVIQRIATDSEGAVR